MTWVKKFDEVVRALEDVDFLAPMGFHLVLRFPLFLKTSASNSNSIWNVPTLVKRVLLVLVPRKCVRKTFCLYHRGLCCIKYIGVYVCLRFLLRLPPGGTPI